MTPAFQLAGARSVPASLWQVPDRSANALMTRFHTHLKSGARKDDALRAAQLELLRGPIELPQDDTSWWAKVPSNLFGGPEMGASPPYYRATFQIYSGAGDY